MSSSDRPEAVRAVTTPQLSPDANSGEEQDRHATVNVPGELTEHAQAEAPGRSHHGFQFWAVMIALCITSLLGSLENTVVTTSLPTIVKDLSFGQNYIWVTNIFFLTR